MIGIIFTTLIFLFRFVVEYKYGLHRKIAFNIRLHFSPIDGLIEQPITLGIGINFLYSKKKNHIFSGAFYPISHSHIPSKLK